MSNTKPLIVEERIRGQKNWPTNNFADFIQTVSVKPLPPKVEWEEASKDREAKISYYVRISMVELRTHALDRICQDIKRGSNLSAADIRLLFPEDIENIKRFGEAYLKQLIDENPPSNSGSITSERDLFRENTYARIKHEEEKKPEEPAVQTKQIPEPTRPLPWPEGYIPYHLREREMEISR